MGEESKREGSDKYRKRRRKGRGGGEGRKTSKQVGYGTLEEG